MTEAATPENTSNADMAAHHVCHLVLEEGVVPAGTVRWWPSGDADAALAQHVRELFGPGEVTVGRLCPSCGSSSHGRPWARHGTRRIPVSLSRSGPHLVTAVLPAPGDPHTEVGVDVEASCGAAWLRAEEILHADDTRDTESLTRAWVAKEAVLKAAGVGLARPMTSVRLADHDVVWLDAPPGYVAALSVGRWEKAVAR